VSRSLKVISCAAVLFGLSAGQARADLSISLQDVSLAPGGIGTMDISVTSNNSDTLSAFGLELLITPSAGSTSLLQFTAAQSDPYGDPNYVFLGTSFYSDNSLPFWFAPYETNYPSDTISGGDADDGTTPGFTTIPAAPGGPDTFLATVQFQAPVGATPGDQFQISLVSDANFTYFDDQSGNPLTIASVSGGLVTISAVPEPTSLSMLAFSSLIGIVWQRARRR
jgi:hypothetical protein